MPAAQVQVVEVDVVLRVWVHKVNLKNVRNERVNLWVGNRWNFRPHSHVCEKEYDEELCDALGKESQETNLVWTGVVEIGSPHVDHPRRNGVGVVRKRVPDEI